MPRETRTPGLGSTGVGDAGPIVRAFQRGVFRKEGEYWTLGYGGKSFRLKDSKRRGDLAHFLGHPATEFYVLALAGGIGKPRDGDEKSPPPGGGEPPKGGNQNAQPGRPSEK